MAESKYIKSSRRVKEHGEVFTPRWMANKMLDQPELQKSINSIETTFLEPSAGEGVFLIEILKRKLKLACDLSESKQEYDEYVLIALSSIYGIELLEDNMEMLVMNLILTFQNEYVNQMYHRFSGKPTKKVVESAKTIIRANMLQGNALTRKNNNNDDLIFSEWIVLPGKIGNRKIKRVEYTMDAIINDGDPVFDNRHSKVTEFDLFSGRFEDGISDEGIPMEYAIVKISDIYKELLIDTE